MLLLWLDERVYFLIFIIDLLRTLVFLFGFTYYLIRL